MIHGGDVTCSGGTESRNSFYIISGWNEGYVEDVFCSRMLATSWFSAPIVKNSHLVAGRICLNYDIMVGPII